MLDCYSTNATVAKIRAINGRMLTKENYHEMLSRRSVNEVAEYLSGTPRFKEAFRDVDTNTVHRGFLEALLNKDRFDTYARLCRFQELDKVDFYDFLVRKRELECILSLINSLNSGADKSYLNELPGYMIKLAKIDLLELSRVQSYEELLKMLKNTPYYKVLVKIPPLEDGSVDYTECELRLRTAYYERLFNQVKHSFSDTDAASLKQMIAGEIDCLNIINAYRMKTFFNYSADEIRKRQIKFSRMGKKLGKYYELESSEEMLEWIKKYAGISEGEGDDFIDVRINQVRYTKLKHIIYRSVSAPVVLYAFMQICNTEIANIVHIIEGIRYGVDPSLIEKNLLIC